MIRRAIFKKNDAFWYHAYLAKNPNISIDALPELYVEFNSYSETKKWIIDNQRAFPWIYKKREIEVADRYKHFFSSLRFKGKIIGFTKIGIIRTYIADYEREIDLYDDEAFIYDTFVLPEFRGKQKGRFMLLNILGELRKKGVLFVYCHIPPWNIASSTLYQNVGFVRSYHVRYLRLFRFHHFTNKPDWIKNEIRMQYSNSFLTMSP